MSGTAVDTTTAAAFHARIGAAAAAALVADFSRHPGPKTALVIGATATSPVLAAAVDALAGDDSLTVVAGTDAPAVREQLERRDAWTRRRVRVVESLADADSADAVIMAVLASGSAEDTQAEVDTLTKHLNPGAVLSVAVAAAPFLAGGAGVELDRLATRHGVGDDLVVRNVPPVRVHRLRFSPAEAGLAAALAPLARTSSIRLTPSMNIDSNGVVAAAACLGVAALARRVAPRSRLWLLPALAAPAVAAFFRDPRREVPQDAQAVVAASDGRVLSVEQVSDDRLGETDFLRIAVFLSVLDVHINRSPVAGRVVDHFVIDGGYAAAMRPEAEHNVAAYTVLETDHGIVAIAQRTGLIARRIVHRAPVGALLARGERFGLIRFGSRTDVYLPAGTATPVVATGDRVTGGETVIARWLTKPGGGRRLSAGDRGGATGLSAGDRGGATGLSAGARTTARGR